MFNKSKEFLDKKVLETSSEKVKYYDKNQNKVYDAIKVTGTSGRVYIIAYDLKESFVFLDANINTAELTSNPEDIIYENETRKNCY